MEISVTLIVILMFASIIGIGIAQALHAIATVLARPGSLRSNILPLSWVLIVLVRLLTMFWSSRSLADQSSWTFLGFLAVLLGPILLLFATTILSTAIEPAVDRRIDAAATSPLITRFFGFYAAAETWMAAADLTLIGSWTPMTTLSLLIALVAIGAAVLKNPVIARWLTATVLLLTVADVVTRVA